MKTVIYLDELLLVNFLIAAFLLPGTALLCGAGYTPRRVAAGAALAALSSLLLLAPRLPFAVQLLLKAAAAALCVRAAFGRQPPRAFLRLCAWYLLLNLTLAGVVSGLILTRPARGLQTNNLVVYLGVSPVLLLACVAAVYLGLRLLLWCFERPRPGAAQPLTLELSGYRVTVQAFCDTGFTLPTQEPDRAGVVLSLPAVQDQLPPALCGFLQAFLGPGGGAAAPLPTPQPEWRLRFVTCTTAAGPGLYPAVLADRVALQRDGQTVCGKALVLFCSQSFPYGCGAAYSPDLPERARRVQPNERGTAV